MNKGKERQCIEIQFKSNEIEIYKGMSIFLNGNTRMVFSPLDVTCLICTRFGSSFNLRTIKTDRLVLLKHHGRKT